MVWTSPYILVTIQGLTRQNAIEGVRGVDCLVVCPGPIPVSENGCNQTSMIPSWGRVGQKMGGSIRSCSNMQLFCWSAKLGLQNLEKNRLTRPLAAEQRDRRRLISGLCRVQYRAGQNWR